MSALSLVAAAKANLTQRAQRQEHRGKSTEVTEKSAEKGRRKPRPYKKAKEPI